MHLGWTTNILPLWGIVTSLKVSLDSHGVGRLIGAVKFVALKIWLALHNAQLFGNCTL